jgi:hypothetical protein
VDVDDVGAEGSTGTDEVVDVDVVVVDVAWRARPSRVASGTKDGNAGNGGNGGRFAAGAVENGTAPGAGGVWV